MATPIIGREGRNLTDTEHLEAREEVERWLSRSGQNFDEALRRFDRDGDGVLDAEEWRAARTVLRREVDQDVAEEVLGGRYRVVRPIGRGAQGLTVLAVDESDASFVALKELDFDDVDGWDAVERFDREAAVLGGLDHPGIPKFLDTFHLDGGRHFLVQEFIDGDNLLVRIESGELFDETRLERIAGQVLEILTYLHGHTPPLIHRDIKPANIVLRNDGALALVDFGAVETRPTGRVVVGTSGYMAPEQLMGRAGPESDLYGLGATLVHLATGRHPEELLDDDLSLRWTEFANLNPVFRRWVDSLVAPVPEDRPRSAEQARVMLNRRSRSALAPRAALEPPSPGVLCNVKASAVAERWRITLPNVVRRRFYLTLALNLLAAAFALGAMTMVGAALPIVNSFAFGLLIVPLVSLAPLYAMERRRIEEVTLDEENITIRYAHREPRRVGLRLVRGAQVAFSDRRKEREVQLVTAYGEEVAAEMLSQVDSEYLVDAIRIWLAEHRTRRLD